MKQATEKLETIKGALLLAQNTLDDLPLADMKDKRKEKARLQEEVKTLKWVVGVLEDDPNTKSSEFLRRYFRASI